MTVTTGNAAAPKSRVTHPSPGKNQDIEALRAIAIGLVLICHLGELLKPRGTLSPLFRFTDYWGGVDIFFCVSGFVIAGTLLRIGRPDSFRQLAVPFYIRRIFRIWPAAFLWLAIAILAAKLANSSGSFGPFRADLRDGVAAVLQVHNIYLSLCNTGQLSHCGKEVIYWSLSLEEQFYMLLPLLLYFVGPMRLRWVLGALILIQFPLARDTPSLLRYIRTDAIAYGVLIAIATRSGAVYPLSRAVERHPLGARLLALLLVLLVALFSVTHELTINVALIALASAGLVLLASCNRDVIVPRGWLRSAFLWGGSRSFGLYLVHQPCFWAAREIFYRSHHSATYDNSFALAATGIGLVVFTAEVSYRIVEAPIREFGHRLSKRSAVRASEDSQPMVPLPVYNEGK
jgi:peptidoglycan/LPS O-acetylase OafA/YrhL